MRVLTAALTALAAATVGVVPPAQADTFSQDFQSPTGGIACTLVYFPSKAARMLGKNFVHCDVGDHSWAAPEPPPDEDEYTLTVLLNRGDEPVLGYRRGPYAASGLVLAAGHGIAGGSIRCTAEADGMTCTDSTTGHFFSVSDESYDLG